ncbi:MAG TPA: TIGR02679 family protein [Acidimicrobiales bacterium]|nr:TIGR02679 family protein [Acidimicrobiales bacterium]
MTALDSPALGRLWDAVAARLERNGLRPAGAVVLDDLTRDERHALAGLIGRPVDGPRARVDLGRLDERLRRTEAAAGLVAAVSARRGPLVDRPARRSAAAERRDALWAGAREELAACGLLGAPWVERWLEDIRPVVGRASPARGPQLLRDAARGLARLPWASSPALGRTDLASTVGGDAHALDDGTVLAALILRGIAAALGVDPPSGALERRLLWERAGVRTDEVSTTVLTLGLRPAGGGPVAGALRARSDAGCETHLTLRDLRRLDGLVAAGTTVWVCENPRVLEAAMDAGVPAVMACTAGNPVVTVTVLLERLAGDGADLRYRGDFDWPGIAIANRVVTGFGATPWRMSTLDYEAALAGAGRELLELPGLVGAPVEAAWDPGLRAAMAGAGRAVHEELILGTLLADLR